MEDDLPLHVCQSIYCANQAGYWPGRIIFIGRPDISIVGWCNICEKYVCNDCALQVQITENEWNDLCNQETALEKYRDCKLIPTSLICRRCGAILQKGKHNKVLVMDASAS
jgi:hypothetical protein